MNPDIILAVEQNLGVAEDNYIRTKLAFQNIKPELMQEMYGKSGLTYAAILAMALSEVERWKKALADVKAMK